MMILVVDTNYLSWRAFYSIKSLRFEDVGTGVPFGVFREILSLVELHQTTKIVFAFDSKYSKRKDIYPQYKQGRTKDLNEEEQAARQECYNQIDRLREKYLPFIGFRNIFMEDGYESDDLIASFCKNLPEGEKAAVVSSDHDLFQLLSKNVMIWNPGKREPYTADAFRTEWGLEPSQWADVKAIAGCNSDDIEGVAGVGEKTAAKFVGGILKPESKLYQKITQDNAVWKRNLPLVSLPFQGTPVPSIIPDEVTEEKWLLALKKLGMVSLERTVRVSPYGQGQRKGFGLRT